MYLWASGNGNGLLGINLAAICLQLATGEITSYAPISTSVITQNITSEEGFKTSIIINNVLKHSTE
jgi:hypothetical protein